MMSLRVGLEGYTVKPVERHSFLLGSSVGDMKKVVCFSVVAAFSCRVWV